MNEISQQPVFRDTLPPPPPLAGQIVPIALTSVVSETIATGACTTPNDVTPLSNTVVAAFQFMVNVTAADDVNNVVLSVNAGAGATNPNTTFSIQIEDTFSSDNLARSARNVSLRSYAGNVTWTAPGNTWSDHTTRSVDITPLFLYVQQLPGWDAGNTIVIKVSYLSGATDKKIHAPLTTLNVSTSE